MCEGFVKSMASCKNRSPWAGGRRKRLLQLNRQVASSSVNLNYKVRAETCNSSLCCSFTSTRRIQIGLREASSSTNSNFIPHVSTCNRPTYLLARESQTQCVHFSTLSSLPTGGNRQYDFLTSYYKISPPPSLSYMVNEPLLQAVTVPAPS